MSNPPERTGSRRGQQPTDEASGDSADSGNSAIGPFCALGGAQLPAEFTGPEQRLLNRLAVFALRPIALRRFDVHDDSRHGPWLIADILNISLGGLCLMVSDREPHPPGLRLQLDLRNHPEFGTAHLLSEVRWCSSFNVFTTLGLAFLTPLERIPRLEHDGPETPAPEEQRT